MSTSRFKQLARRLTGTDATVRNVAAHLRAERELIQSQARQLHTETTGAIEQFIEAINERTDHAAEQDRLARQGLEEAVGVLRDSVEEVNGKLESKLTEITRAVGQLNEQSPGHPDPPEDIEASVRERLDRQGVFCVGSARSGTTILMHCLNRSPRIHVVGECNSYRRQTGQDFRRVFNERMAGIGNPRFKGTWLPDLDVEPSEPRRYFAALSRSFEFVGEKVAFGPEAGIANHTDRFLDWQSRHFHRSTYFCTSRDPVACVWSMCKMFPQIDRRHVCRTWLRTAALTVDLYRTFPNAYVIFNEDFSETTIERIGEILGVRIDLAPGMISERHVHTRATEDLPDVLAPVETELGELGGIYRDLRSCFDPISLREDAARFMIPVFGTLRRNIDGLLERFDERDAESLVGPMQSAEAAEETGVRQGAV